MKTKNPIDQTLLIILVACLFLPFAAQAQKTKKINQPAIDTIMMNLGFQGSKLQIDFIKGEAHNHPTFVVWIEDMDNNVLETLFVTQSFGTGVYSHADAGHGTWSNKKGKSLRPAALPYWSHKQNSLNGDSLHIPTPQDPVPDAFTGPTPTGNFVLETATKNKLPKRFKLMFEVNQTWDWNDYWTNNKYPNNLNYQSSAQPSVIYSVDIDENDQKNLYQLKVIGHGHYSGSTGELYKDISTLTTALNIADQISVKITQ